MPIKLKTGESAPATLYVIYRDDHESRITDILPTKQPFNLLVSEGEIVTKDIKNTAARLASPREH
jgi:hypothetical protein